MSENVGAALERAARLFGEREALVDGELRWTYRELEARVAGFDAALDGLGLKAGDVVGVLALNSAAHLVVVAGDPAQRPGAQRPQLPPGAGRARVHPRRLGRAGADGRRRVPRRRARAGRGCETVEHLIYMGAGETPDGCLSFSELAATDGRAAATVDPDDVAGIFYTGGTTGPAEGRDAHAPQPRGQRQAHADRDRLPDRRLLPARGADVPPRRRRVDRTR